ncbi:drebrin-like protein isoform X2 [Hyposmocoma kahamanoa]|uniref:drebrin-like protein isoform X2 n=1 Tax=Hyposmocoma kahamanoa TaxID=1477025 RepID=UPI000E6D89A8|nr:drebrin-like protein isoform X2 [Hyposmocoma kahamanoa]
MIKGDRIEAIRKKFEAFLEEDKKRKQRNEYILGKLDKMCTCKALVPQYKPNLSVGAYGPQLQGRQIPYLDRCVSNLVMCSSHGDNLNLSNFENNSQIFQEIVQKFILIPKNQAVSEVNVEQPKQQQAQHKSGTDDINWKSKYDILNQLKENDKEPTKLITVTNEIPTKEQPMKDTNESNRHPATHSTLPDVHSENSISIQSCYKPQKCDDNRLEGYADFMIQELRENVNYDIDDQFKTAGTSEQIESNSESKFVYRNTQIKQASKGHAGDSNSEFLDIHNNYNVKSLEHENNDYQTTQENVTDNAKSEFLLDNSSIQQKSSTNALNEFNNSMQQYTEKSEQSESMQHPINVMNPEEFTPRPGVVLDDGVNINSKDEQSERTQYPLDVINYEEFIPNENVVLQDGGHINYEGYKESDQSERTQYSTNDTYNPEEFTSNDGVAIGEAVNTNPEGYEEASNYGTVTLSHQPGNVDDTVEPDLGQTEIEENPTVKGIEEFEAEQRDMWHEPPGENAAYSQEAYEQPNQYYYEQGQEYPVDVNEHAETQLNYDQSYQQQYVNQYEAQYQQENQQYDQTQSYHEGYEQNYDAQPVYDGYNEEESNHHQQQILGTPQTIEQELDKEQDFVEKDIEKNEAPDTNAPESPANTGVKPMEMK